MPAPLRLTILAITVLYALATEVQKAWFYRRTSV